MTRDNAKRMTDASILSAVSIIAVANGLAPESAEYLVGRFRAAVARALSRFPSAPEADDDDDYCDLGGAAPGILEVD